MITIKTRLIAFSLCGWLVIGGAGLVRGQGSPVSPSRDEQIKQIEKQIQDLNKSLTELKKSDAPAQSAESEVPLPAAWLKGLTWRSIGPANMGGRIVALSVFEADPSTYWVGTAGGGLLKTENNGITFTHQFDKESTVAIGDVCVAPSDKNIVWLGTGENNPRNSVSYGDGVYKSTDGGKTWTNMGLKETFQIGRILIHPKDPNIVYVGALGRLYGFNTERGLYKTTDGGKTWNKILYVDDKTGIIDMRMHPTDPETLIVAAYERQRDLYDTNDPSKKWGPGSGLYKTNDGGKTFKKLTEGLPTCQLGRIGIDWSRKDPKNVYIILESERIGMGTAPKTTPQGTGFLGALGQTQEDKVVIGRVVDESPAEKAGIKPEDLITALADKPIRSYEDLTEQLRPLNAGDKIKLRINRAGQPIEVEVTLGERPQGGPGGGGGGGQGGRSVADPKHPNASSLGGQRENVQDQGPDSFEYGGIYKSTNAGESWTRINSLNPRPMYFSQLRVDPSDEQYLYVLGVSLYRSADGGKTFRPDGGRGMHSDQHALWIDPSDGRHMIVGCDGGFYVTYDRMANWDHLNHMAIGQFYHVAIDTTRDYKVYGGLQDNGSWGGPSRTHSQNGPVNDDWVSVGGGDGFKCQVDPNDPDQVYYSTQNGGLGRRNLHTGETGFLRPRPERNQEFHFNWNTPFILSHHNSRIFYTAGNYVFRSLDRGNDLRTISPEITHTKLGSASAISESPRDPNVLYVGTDDGALWVTKDGGHEWTDITKNVGLAGPRHVATIEASRFEDGRAYAAFDGHRSDDDEPLIYQTEDFGKTWSSLRSNLPRGSTRCLREDLKSADLLFVGTEFGFWASLDRGRSWNSLNTNLPTVAVHDVAIHPTAGEIVVATHGRSLWVLDITPLRQTNKEVVKSAAYLYQPTSAIRWRAAPRRGQTNRRFVGQNPPAGASVDYVLTGKAENISLKVVDVNGKTVRELRPSNEPGLHRILWDMTRTQAQPVRATRPAESEARPAGANAAESEADAPRRTANNFQRPRLVPPGMYRILLSVDGKELTQTVRVEPDPAVPTAEIIAESGEDVDQPMFDADEEEEADPDGPILD
ncbi:MAG TPA: PDZ domain-containing protein [Isosphaeraceae bacterium]|nr:PDZ domain-containing protein [Isosphaeraceae bacterium]